MNCLELRGTVHSVEEKRGRGLTRLREVTIDAGGDLIPVTIAKLPPGGPRKPGERIYIEGRIGTTGSGEIRMRQITLTRERFRPGANRTKSNQLDSPRETGDKRTEPGRESEAVFVDGDLPF